MPSHEQRKATIKAASEQVANGGVWLRPANEVERNAVLDHLRVATNNRRLAQESWEAAIDWAVEAGFSERVIAQAAGVSGPAINQRKRRNG